MRRVVIAAVSTIAGLGILLGLKTQVATSRAPMVAEGDNTHQGSSTGSQVQTPTPAVGDRATNRSTHPPADTSAPDISKSRPHREASTTRRKVAGRTVETQYGPVQVQVTMVATRITDVTALQLPNDKQRSREIASFSEPQLRKEALSAQSARIDAVSGATYTSEGYIESLQAALDRARA